MREHIREADEAGKRRDRYRIVIKKKVFGKQKQGETAAAKRGWLLRFLHFFYGERKQIKAPLRADLYSN